MSAGKDPWQEAPLNLTPLEHKVVSLAEITRSDCQSPASGSGHFMVSTGAKPTLPLSQNCILSSALFEVGEGGESALKLSDTLRPGLKSGTFLSSTGDALSSSKRDNFGLSPHSGSSDGSPHIRADLHHFLRPDMRSGTTWMASNGDALSSSRRDLLSATQDFGRAHCNSGNINHAAHCRSAICATPAGRPKVRPVQRPASAGAVTARGAAHAASTKPWHAGSRRQD